MYDLFVGITVALYTRVLDRHEPLRGHLFLSLQLQFLGLSVSVRAGVVSFLLWFFNNFRIFASFVKFF